jgi:hypothetical protein
MTQVIVTSQRAQQRPVLASQRVSSILLALLGLSAFCGAHGATLVVAPGAAAVVDGDGECSLIEAIDNANADAALHPDCPAGSGADVIVLATGSTHTLTTVIESVRSLDLPFGLPQITSAITIRGNKSVIERSRAADTPPFGLFDVATTGTLNLRGIAARNAKAFYAIETGGRMTLENSSVSGNTGGGAFFNHDFGILRVVNSALFGNSTPDGSGLGGGIFNRGDARIIRSSITGNSVGVGGGIYNNGGSVILDHATIANNSAGEGGGIYHGGKLTAVNSTLSGNSSIRDAGGVFVQHGTATFINSTLAGNTSQGPGGGVLHQFGTLNLTNTIIVNSQSGGDCMIAGGSIGTNVNNLVGDGGCGAAVVGDPKLGPLANNGGSTLTHALLAGSRAIDTGADCSRTLTNGVDQRGLKRDLHCDIGAVEYDSKPLTATLGNTPAITRPGATFYTFSVTYRDNLAVDMGTVGADDVSVTDANGNPLAVSLVPTPDATNTRVRTIRYKVRPPNGKWDAGANGTYFIKLNAGAVRDTTGNAATGGVLGSFTVNIAAP